jgi:hypothetical protein
LKVLKVLKVLLKASAAVLTAAALTGCNLISTDVGNLMQLPKLTAEQRAIEEALAKYAGANYTFKYPGRGDYRSSIVMRDIDSSGTQIAVIFYTPDADSAGTHAMILENRDGSFYKISDLSGDGSDVDKISFGDFDGDGRDEIAIGWTMLTSTDYSLCVYALRSGSYVLTTKTNYNEMTVSDINGDGKKDIFIIKADTAEKKTVASLISHRDGSLRVVSTAPLDSTVSKYAQLLPTKIKGSSNGVLIDGYKGAHSMVTDLIYWKSGGLAAPFYDSGTGTVPLTLRSYPLACADINGDGYAEIPRTTELPGYSGSAYENKMWLAKWSLFDGKNGFATEFTGVINSAEGYYFIFPSSWNNKIWETGYGNVTVEKAASNKAWIFKKWDWQNNKAGSALFTIRTYTQSQWASLINEGNISLLSKNEGVVYAAELSPKQQDTAQIYLSIGEIKNRFKIIQ